MTHHTVGILIPPHSHHIEGYATAQISIVYTLTLLDMRVCAVSRNP